MIGSKRVTGYYTPGTLVALGRCLRSCTTPSAQTGKVRLVGGRLRRVPGPGVGRVTVHGLGRVRRKGQSFEFWPLVHRTAFSVRVVGLVRTRWGVDLGGAPTTGQLRVILFKGHGDNGSSLVGTLAKRSATLMSSVPNAAASTIDGTVRVRRVNPYLFVSAPKFSSRKRLKRVHVAHALGTVRQASVTLLLYRSNGYRSRGR